MIYLMKLTDCSCSPSNNLIICFISAVIGSTFVKESLHGLYPILTSSLTDKSAIPRAMRLVSFYNKAGNFTDLA